MKWLVPGDIDGFFGLMVDNLIQLLVLISLLSGLCGFPLDFIYKEVLPGIAISLVIGNFYYAYQARKLALAENRTDVTALPYGVNTVSLFAFVFFVILPISKATGDYKTAWRAGLAASFLSGLIEIFGSFFAEKIRSITPRASMLSALAGIAITFIAMDFLIKTYQNPIVSFIPLGIILMQYFGRFSFPYKIPGGLLSVVVGTLIAWLHGFWGKPIMSVEALSNSGKFLGFYLPSFTAMDIYSIMTSINFKDFLAVIIPMGVFNVIGSLQNIESAEAAGDKFNTRDSLIVNGVGTVIGSFFGSPFPTTIYIGHPGWKALGARWGYSILNGVFMTVVCFIGLMDFVKSAIPIEAGMAIILWIGIIIGAQAFDSTPKHHSPAIIVGLFPAVAGWGMLVTQSIFTFANFRVMDIMSKAGIKDVHTITIADTMNIPNALPFDLGGLLALSQGFLLVSMIWASISVCIIERDFVKAAYWSLSASVLSAIGLIHAYKLNGNVIMNQFNFIASPVFMISYLLLAALFYISSFSKNKETIAH